MSETASVAAPLASRSSAPAANPVHAQRIPAIPLALSVVFLGFALFPPVRTHETLSWTFLGFGTALLAWSSILWALAAKSGRSFAWEFVSIKSHWVQAIVQGTIYVYWGSHSPGVIGQIPLILSQIVFLYALTGLLAWSRGRTWQLGFGPLPVILSTNLLLWFRNDWFFFQFFMVTTGALGKEFVTWMRDGRKTHIFNPSVFGQSIFALGMILTATTAKFSLGEEIAVSFENLPHIISLIFILGLVVQYNFSVTLMTLSAAATLCALNLTYTGLTGTYYFVTLNIGATVFLGLHLLVTDPSTSPRSNSGRVIFGALYALGYAALFALFDRIGVPVFWDKLLPVPILNLLVPAIDRISVKGILGRFNRWWEEGFLRRRSNLVHMGGWAALFGTILLTGFVEGQHEGRSLAFWRKAYEENRYGAAENFRRLVLYRARDGDGEASNMLGKMHLAGELVPKDEAAAAHWFAKACELGYDVGCENVAGQFLFQRRADSPQAVQRALDRLEKDCAASGDGLRCFLVGFAYENGLGRTQDPNKAKALYTQGARQGNVDAAKGIVRIAIGTRDSQANLAEALAPLEKSCASGDAESCLFLANMYRLGVGVAKDETKAAAFLAKARKPAKQ